MDWFIWFFHSFSFWGYWVEVKPIYLDQEKTKIEFDMNSKYDVSG